MEHTTVEAKSQEALADKVSSMMREGWRRDGEMTQQNGVFVQRMSREPRLSMAGDGEIVSPRD